MDTIFRESKILHPYLYSCILVFLYSCILAFLDKKGIFTAIFASNSINSLNKGANVSNKTIFFSF